LGADGQLWGGFRGQKQRQRQRQRRRQREETGAGERQQKQRQEEEAEGTKEAGREEEEEPAGNCWPINIWPAGREEEISVVVQSAKWCARVARLFGAERASLKWSRPSICWRAFRPASTQWAAAAEEEEEEEARQRRG